MKLFSRHSIFHSVKKCSLFSPFFNPKFVKQRSLQQRTAFRPKDLIEQSYQSSNGMTPFTIYFYKFFIYGEVALEVLIYGIYLPFKITVHNTSELIF